MTATVNDSKSERKTMSNFYNQGQDSSNAGMSGGFYNSGGGYGQQQQQQQPEQPQQSQAAYGFQGANVQQWQQSSMQRNHGQQQNPYYQPHQQQQQQQQFQAPAFWEQNGAAAVQTGAAAVAGLAMSAASGGLSSDQMIDWAVKGGSAAWGSGGASMIPGFEATMLLLRPYFSVDNRYVKRKMQKILFPFMSLQWKRVQSEQQGPDAPIQYALPHSDENAPDLYLPAMSLVTYCLLCAFCKGTAGEFNPKVIADTTTKCFVTQILEVAIIRFGFYMMHAPVSLLDLFSYTGYKYLGLSLNMMFGLMFGHFGYGTTGFYLTFLWTASAAAFFMLKTMANNIPTVTAATGPKREVMVLAFAASQALSMWFVSQTKFL